MIFGTLSILQLNKYDTLVYRKLSVRRSVDLSLRGVKRRSNPQSREIASPVFQRGRNDILLPPVTEGLRFIALKS
jgi:hypothetical protein